MDPRSLLPVRTSALLLLAALVLLVLTGPAWASGGYCAPVALAPVQYAPAVPALAFAPAYAPACAPVALAAPQFLAAPAYGAAFTPAFVPAYGQRFLSTPVLSHGISPARIFSPVRVVSPRAVIRAPFVRVLVR